MKLEILNEIFNNGHAFALLALAAVVGIFYTRFKRHKTSQVINIMTAFAMLLVFSLVIRLLFLSVSSSRYIITVVLISVILALYLIKTFQEYEHGVFSAGSRRWIVAGFVLILTAFCIGKDLHVGASQSRERQAINWFAQAKQNGILPDCAILSFDPRTIRYVQSSGETEYFSQVYWCEKPGQWQEVLHSLLEVNNQVLIFGSNRQQESQKIMAGLNSDKTLAKIETVMENKNFFAVLCSGNSTESETLNHSGKTVFYDDFDEIKSIKIDQNGQLNALKKRGVGFLQKEYFDFSPHWQPNPAHAYNASDLKSLKLEIIDQGIKGRALYYNGAAQSSLRSVKLFDSAKRYRVSFFYRGSLNSRIYFFTYRGTASNLKSYDVTNFSGNGKVAYASFDLENFNDGEYYLAMLLEGGEITIDKFKIIEL